MEKALEILQHIEKLYSKDYDEGYAIKLASKNPDMVEAWNDAFKEYDLVDVLNAIDEYWNFKSSKSKPSVAHIKALLSVKKDIVKAPENELTGERYIDYASSYMDRDVKLGVNRHLLPIYKLAVKYIVEDLLSREISSQEWNKLDYSGRCSRAMELGLFNRFNDALVYVCQKAYGKDYQF